MSNKVVEFEKSKLSAFKREIKKLNKKNVEQNHKEIKFEIIEETQKESELFFDVYVPYIKVQLFVEEV